MNPKKQLGLETSVIEYHLCICFELGPACWRKTLQLLAFKDWRLSAVCINRAHVIWKWHQKKFWIYFRLMMSYGFPRLWCQSRKQFVFIRRHLYIYIYVKPTRIGIALGQHGRDGTLSERNCLGNVFVTVRDCTAWWWSLWLQQKNVVSCHCFSSCRFTCRNFSWNLMRNA
jgi:hypothetical protein